MENRFNNNNRGGNGGGFKTPYVPNALDDRKLALTAPPVEGGKMPANFRITFPSGNPRAVCDMGPGIPSVSGKMDMIDFFRLLELVRRVAGDPNESAYEMKLKSPPVDESGGRARGAPVHIATIDVGRTSKGRMFISVRKATDERAPVRFYFGQGYFSHIARINGEPLTDTEISSETAMGWVRMYETLIPAAHLATFKPREPKQGQQPGNSYNKQPPKNTDDGDFGETKKEPASDYDDDIPF